MELKNVKGIGPKTLFHLNEEGIYTIYDLINRVPKNYVIYEIDNHNLFSCSLVSISCLVDSKPVFLKYRRNVNTVIFYVLVGEVRVKCVSFSSDYLRYKLLKGQSITLYGRYKKENKEFMVQNIFFENFDIKISVEYKLKNINDGLMKKIVISALSQQTGELEETLPIELCEKYKLYTFHNYIMASHFPKNKMDYIQIQRRRKYEEFFWYSISIELLKQNRKNLQKVKREFDLNQVNAFIKGLSFSLTEGQIKTLQEIQKDMLSPITMNRLVQGDVGCGKSIVAYIAALMAIFSGYQVVLMVPTELLAIQQYENIKQYFSSLNFQVEVLTSSVKNKDREDILYRLMSHRVNFIVGTHALLEENVIFNKLGLVMIDEQHRFGVNQRSKLISKFPGVDCLYFTATPIPRTLGLTTFGDLDISSIYSLPANRIPIQTFKYDYSQIKEVSAFIQTHIDQQEQVYVVCPLVNPSEEIDAIDVNKAYEMFASNLENTSIQILHGKMSSIEKKQIMQNFKNKKIQVLISTTVIEVGVDVKDATIMVILDAERYGLAQIHQLRGRVGRSDKQSFCFLISNLSTKRFDILCKYTDGFEIAQEDFKLRGPGDYFGDIQSGFVSLNYADFETDIKIWECASKDGSDYITKLLNSEVKSNRFIELVQQNKNQKGKIN